YLLPSRACQEPFLSLLGLLPAQGIHGHRRKINATPLPGLWRFQSETYVLAAMTRQLVLNMDNPGAMSISAHRRASSSTWRIPLVTAMTYKANIQSSRVASSSFIACCGVRTSTAFRIDRGRSTAWQTLRATSPHRTAWFKPLLSTA